ncbi:MAG: hypothetical protein WC657_01190 [Candidatus Paceibacterota bacterium]|jgi:hypothetical protein
MNLEDENINRKINAIGEEIERATPKDEEIAQEIAKIEDDLKDDVLSAENAADLIEYFLTNGDISPETPVGDIPNLLRKLSAHLNEKKDAENEQ